MFDIMTKYQHYGMCTRLLDLTTNPLVALYFACKKHGVEKYDTEDGEVEKEPYGVIYYTDKYYPSQSTDIEVQIVSDLASYDLEKENTLIEVLEKLYHDKIIHKLRHTAATLMYQTGNVDILTLKQLLGHAVLLVWGYAGVCALWGTQYYGTNFAARAGMTAPPVSTGELAAVTDYFADKVNAAAPLVQRDESGVFATDKTEIFAGCAHLYDPLTERWPFLAGPERRPKPAIYSKLMSAWGFTGYLCPLVGESTLNVDSPAVFLPVTIAHELAHQRGVAAEQEANFVGVMAATASADADYAYSGWLFGYLHLSNALYEADPALAAASYQTLCAEARADLAANNAYWKQWEGLVKQTGEKVYTTFLQGYGQDLGMRSYGACVDLLVEEFLTNTTSCD